MHTNKFGSHSLVEFDKIDPGLVDAVGPGNIFCA
jgi:hypothetical protein